MFLFIRLHNADQKHEEPNIDHFMCCQDINWPKRKVQGLNQNQSLKSQHLKNQIIIPFVMI